MLELTPEQAVLLTGIVVGLTAWLKIPVKYLLKDHKELSAFVIGTIAAGVAVAGYLYILNVPTSPVPSAALFGLTVSGFYRAGKELTSS